MLSYRKAAAKRDKGTRKPVMVLTGHLSCNTDILHS